MRIGAMHLPMGGTPHGITTHNLAFMSPEELVKAEAQAKAGAAAKAKAEARGRPSVGTEDACYHADTQAHPTCSGYEGCGYSCSPDGRHCATMGCRCDCSLCAKKAPMGFVAEQLTGKCVPSEAGATKS